MNVCNSRILQFLLNRPSIIPLYRSENSWPKRSETEH
jgi:hypothetical protein